MADHINLGGDPPEVVTRPSRIRFNRRDGLQLPEGAKLVTRVSRYGNPYKVHDLGGNFQAVWLFNQFLKQRRAAAPDWVNPHPKYPSDEQIREQLAGWDLACACAVDEPWCHADTLLALANPKPEKAR